MFMQTRKPIILFSKARLSLGNVEKSRIFEKELVELVLAVQHWCPYLFERSFTVYSNQKTHTTYCSSELPQQIRNVGRPSFWVTILTWLINQDLKTMQLTPCPNYMRLAS